MTSMDVFLTGVPAGAIGVSDGFESPSPSARTMVLCLIARRLDDDDDDDDDDVDDVSLECRRDAFIFVPVKNTDACCGARAKLIIASCLCVFDSNDARATSAKNTTMSVKSFDESEASEKRVKSKKITHTTTLFFIRGRRI